MLFPSVSLCSGCQEFVSAIGDCVFFACKNSSEEHFFWKRCKFLNSDAANMPVNAGRLRQLHLLHRAYGALYNASCIVRTTIGRIAPMECPYPDVSTALFAVLCSSLTLTFM